LMEEVGRNMPASRESIRKRLADLGLGTFTFNAFPYGNFHDKVVKTKVYSPDWTEVRRLDYTVACARLLAYLLPAGGEGSISTLPLGWRIGWTADHGRRAAARLCEWITAALRIADKDGKAIRLGLEPEPGCALETTAQAIAFWEECLRPAARAAGLSPEAVDAHMGLCYDTCHQAVQFEEAAAALDRLAAAGIPIAKMQLSSALEFLPDPRRESAALRREFCEERFLHQTRIRTPEGMVSFDDLPQALDHGKDGRNGPDLWAHAWRVHFHVPIDARGLLDPQPDNQSLAPRISTTRDEMVKAYRHARLKGLCRHFEVETYTWSVMPPAHRPATDDALAECIARELLFIESLDAHKEAPGADALA
jgi:sugar phosphate isomerase/epimerase